MNYTNPTTRLMSQLSYSPLRPNTGDIRLVRLYCGHFQDPVRFDLTQAPIEDFKKNPGYEALSYTWGDPLDTRTVIFKDEPIEVTKNLEAAMRHLRYQPVEGAESNERLLWIDALCINQKNILERNSEVRRMLDIYKSAIRVVIWLGEGNETSDIAMDLVNAFARPLSNIKTFDVFREILSRPTQSDKWLALAQGLLTRPWWSRIWIVQEVAVARDLLVVCGERTAPWNILVLLEQLALQYHAQEVTQALEYAGKESASSANQGTIIDHIRHEWISNQLMTVHQFMSYLRFFNATDPRDRLYAYLGLCVDADAALLEPDYAKEIWQVYAQLAAHIILQQKKLDFMCADIGTKLISGLPSWAPDLSRTKDELSNPLKSLSSSMGENLYHASAKIPMEINFSDDMRTLRANGLIFGTVTSLADYWDPRLSTKDFLVEFPIAISKWEKFIITHGESFVSKNGFGGARLAFSKTVTADRALDEFTVSRLPAQQGALELFAEGVPSDFEKDIDHERREELFLEATTQWFISTLKYRCFAFVNSEFLGLLPRTAMEGDTICILFGCDTPVVLRPQSNTYSFVGEW
jgi:hypothetical protein